MADITSPMIDRMAEALHDRMWSLKPWCPHDLVRAALEIGREPSLAMVQAVERAGLDRAAAAQAWRLMTDAILADQNVSREAEAS